MSVPVSTIGKPEACMSMLAAVLFIIKENGKHSKCSSVEAWMNQMWGGYTMD